MGQTRKVYGLKLVQLVTLTRIAGAVVFAAVAITDAYHRIALIVYLCTLATDLLDGRLARMLGVTTELGAAFDGVADKYVAVAATLFLAALGLPLVACCLILLRDVVVQGLRTVHLEGLQLFAPNRRLGGISGLPIRVLTLYVLVNQATIKDHLSILSFGVWSVACASLLSLIYSIYRERLRISEILNGLDRNTQPSPEENCRLASCPTQDR
jgi:phosphatidylglycerophosphate synthase